MSDAGEIRESQFENLMDGQFGKSAGANRVTGGKNVNQMPIKLGQRFGADPVCIAGDGFGAVLPIVVIVGVAEFPQSARLNQTCRVVPSR